MTLLPRRATAAATALTLATVLAACSATGDDGAPTAGTSPSSPSAGAVDDSTLTIYSGRNENLVGPLLEDLETAVGTDV